MKRQGGKSWARLIGSSRVGASASDSLPVEADNRTTDTRYGLAGKRFIDIEISRNGEVLGGIETKVGSSRYTPLQQLKDWWLTEIKGYPVNVARQP